MLENFNLNITPYLSALQELGHWDLKTHLEQQQVSRPQDEPSILPLFCHSASSHVCSLMPGGRLGSKKKLLDLLKRPPESGFKPKQNTDLMPESSRRPQERTFYLANFILLLDVKIL